MPVMSMNAGGLATGYGIGLMIDQQILGTVIGITTGVFVGIMLSRRIMSAQEYVFHQ